MRAHLALVLVALPITGACRDLEVVSASYATLNEARRAGAIERGWIPQGLPAGTYEIREAHDLDSNRRWGLFSFPPSDAAGLKKLLRPDEASLEGVRVDIPARLEWWPVLVRGALDADQIRTTGLRAYRTKNGELVVLVNWDQGRAYYWGSSTVER